MENKEKKSFGSPSDWGMVLGGTTSAVGFMRLISGLMGDVAQWTASDAPASIGGQGNTTISVAILAVGLVIVAIGYAIRRRT